MRKLVMLAVLAIMFGTANGQTVKKNADGVYTTVSTKKSGEDTKTGEFFKTSKGEKFPIYKSVNGKYYIIRVSKTTGKSYKQYLKLEN